MTRHDENARLRHMLEYAESLTQNPNSWIDRLRKGHGAFRSV